MNTKILLSVLVLFSLLASCNMPVAQAPGTQPSGIESVSSNRDDEISTAVALTAAARFTEMADSVPATITPGPAFTLTPTPCSPLVTANLNANIRSGPGTAYDIVGALMLGQSATIAGRNDANTWWYINYPSAGNYAWVAGSVVTASCVPSVVQVVAAPPLPTTGPVADTSSSDDSDGEEESSSGGDSGGGASGGMPDLVPTGMSVSPNPATQHEEVQVMVGVKNQGNAPSGSFTIQWWKSAAIVGCSWTVASLAPGESTNKSCPYTYGGWSVGYTIKLVIDSGNTVTESNEGNNAMVRKLKVNQAP